MGGLRPCLEPHCPTLTRGGRCPEHQAQKEHSRELWVARRWYRTARWAALRALVLQEEPLCMCDVHQGQDARYPSEVIDHTQPHRGDHSLFWDRANLHGFAESCHGKKTRRGL